jgi:hypothetical protein
VPTDTYPKERDKREMADVPEKQIKRLKSLIQEAETSLAAAKELLVSLVGDDENLSARVAEEPLGKVIEGVFDGQLCQ